MIWIFRSLDPIFPTTAHLGCEVDNTENIPTVPHSPEGTGAPRGRRPHGVLHVRAPPRRGKWPHAYLYIFSHSQTCRQCYVYERE